MPIWLIATLLVSLPFGLLALLAFIEEKIRLREQRKAEEQLAQGISEVARQVAHDIRSPLMALDIALRGELGVPVEKRNLIDQASDRIKSIAEDLLSKSRELKVAKSSMPAVSARSAEECSGFDIISSTSSVLCEKKVSFSKISFVDSELDGQHFVIGVQNDFERLCSNLLQNSIEALSDTHDPRI